MEGKLLNNRYEIRKIIGTGGMAIVYDGYDNVLSREVAIKILKDTFVNSEQFVDKLQMEAQASASINDDNIVSIYDAATTEINGKIIEYIVMEKVKGQTLRDIIKKEAPLSLDKIINYSLQISKALQTAHRHGLVHRDIKPANILITEDDKVKVTDFGIARVSSDATLTYTSSILGTVHYISPEQAKGQIIDERSDLYSLGVVLYEMATGKVPFDGESPVSIAVKHIQEKPTPVVELNKEIGEDFSNLISKLLEKKPEDRYKTASNLLIDLNRIKDGQKLDIALSDTLKLNTQNIKNESRKVSYSKKPKIVEKVEDKKRNYFAITSISLILIFGLFYVVYTLSGEFIKQTEEQNYVNMPSLLDVNEDVARKKIEELGLSANIIGRVYDDNIINGNVISQSIPSGTKVKKGAVVDLNISRGKELVTVPDIRGFDVQNVEQILKDKHLKINERTTEKSDAPKNQIIKQIPEAGTKVEKGSKIDIVLSTGPDETKVIVPNLIKLRQNLAISTIRDAGLIPGKISSEYSDIIPEGDVIYQSIEPSVEVEQGTTIDIVISIGKKPIKQTIKETPKETHEESIKETPREREENKPRNERNN